MTSPPAEVAPDSAASTTPATPGSPVNLGSASRGSLLNLIGAGIAAVAGFSLTVAVTRGFSPTDAGVFFAVTSLFMLFERIAELGAPTGIVYFVARFRSLGAIERIRPVMRAAFAPVLVFSVALAVVLIVLADPLARLIVDEQTSEFAGYLRILACFLPICSALLLLLGGTRGLSVMRPTVLVDSIGRNLLQLLFVLVAVLVGSSTILVVGWVLPYALATLAAAFLLRRMLARRGIPSMSGKERMGREFWRFTWPRALASVAQLGLQRLDIVMVAALRGPVEAAIYTAATRFLVVGQLTGSAITTSVEPRLSERLAHDDRVGAKMLYRTATGWSVLATWPLHLLAAVFAPTLVTVFGDSYDSGAQVVTILALTMLLASGVGMVDTVLIMAGKTTWNLYNVLLALAVNISLNLLLIPGLGILGAAIAWSAALLAKNLIPLVQIAVTLGLHPFGRASATAMGLSLLCFGAVPLAVRLGWGSSLLTLVLSAALSTLLLAAACWPLRRVLHLDELIQLRRRRS